MNWATLDLNLLRVLAAMLREANTTRVGERLGLSQPAVSAALRRLRAHLGDPLFVREGSGMVATAYAESLRDPLRAGLEQIERTLTGTAPFDPAESRRLFRLSGNGHLAEALLPKLVAIMMKRAPHMRLQLLPTDPRTIAQQLADGSIDFAYARAAEDPPDWVDRAPAFRPAFIVIASAGNRRIADARLREHQTFPLDIFCEMPQALLSPDGAMTGAEDAALAAIGRNRKVVLTVPDFFGLSRVVARSQLIGLAPTWFVRSIGYGAALRSYALPFEMPDVPLNLYWHRRHTGDQEHRWMRERTLEVLATLDFAPYPPRGRAIGLKMKTRERKAGRAPRATS